MTAKKLDLPSFRIRPNKQTNSGLNWTRMGPASVQGFCFSESRRAEMKFHEGVPLPRGARRSSGPFTKDPPSHFDSGGGFPEEDGQPGSPRRLWRQLRENRARRRAREPENSLPTSAACAPSPTFPLASLPKMGCAGELLRSPRERGKRVRAVFPAYITHPSFGEAPIQLQSLKGNSAR